MLESGRWLHSWSVTSHRFYVRSTPDEIIMMRVAKVLGAAVWIGRRYLMFLEITRWHHVKPSLAFNPGPPIPGTDIRPHPGVPLILLYVACAAAPLFTVGAVIGERRHRRA